MNDEPERHRFSSVGDVCTCSPPEKGPYAGSDPLQIWVVRVWEPEPQSLGGSPARVCAQPETWLQQRPGATERRGGSPERMQPEWLAKGWIRRLYSCCSSGLLGALFIALVGGVVSGLLGPWTYYILMIWTGYAILDLDPTSTYLISDPTARTGLLIGLLVGLTCLLFVGLAGIWPSKWSSESLLLGLFTGLVFAPFVGLLVGLFYGGTACIKHVLLRLFLWRTRCIPWHYSRFLDYAAEHILLRKVGGGYIFYVDTLARCLHNPFVHRIIAGVLCLAGHDTKVRCRQSEKGTGGASLMMETLERPEQTNPLASILRFLRRV